MFISFIVKGGFVLSASVGGSGWLIRAFPNGHFFGWKLRSIRLDRRAPFVPVVCERLLRFLQPFSNRRTRGGEFV